MSSVSGPTDPTTNVSSSSGSNPPADVTTCAEAVNTYGIYASQLAQNPSLANDPSFMAKFYGQLCLVNALSSKMSNSSANSTVKGDYNTVIKDNNTAGLTSTDSIFTFMKNATTACKSGMMSTIAAECSTTYNDYMREYNIG
ncbi:MAG: hypothetical protein HYZ47_00730 [Simkania negevensis]|nr:hypothetical protein [Simkania negevensis]